MSILFFSETCEVSAHGTMPVDLQVCAHDNGAISVTFGHGCSNYRAQVSREGLNTFIAQLELAREAITTHSEAMEILAAHTASKMAEKVAA
jgi:hypothetical protein